MNVFLEYLVQNWALILILLAFAIMLKITIFLDKRTVLRMYVLIVAVFLLSICVYTEFHLAEIGQYRDVRLAMIAIRYSSTPIILSMILFTLVKKARWYVLIPAGLLAVLNFVSIPTGIVFFLDSADVLQRGVLGYLPYVGVGVYGFFLVFILIRQSNKQAAEIIPIAFLAFAFGSGLVLPFLMGKDYSKIFCVTVAIALFVYYVFLILQLTKKDSLTGLLNRQAFYSMVQRQAKDITAFVSIDMNGLKTINDQQGHLAGDEALTTLAQCFSRATWGKQSAFRIGGDEFMIICLKATEEELAILVERIRRFVAETPYHCSIGYCYNRHIDRNLRDMQRQSDEMMYADKARFYSESGKDRRAR